MKLFNVETGPWGGLVLIVMLIAIIGAFWFTTWIVSGALLALVVIVPVGLLVYFGGRRASRRLIHGKRRGGQP